MQKIRKIILTLLLLTTTTLFTDTMFNEIYKQLQGTWTTPSQSEFSAQFDFEAGGKFTALINPLIDYKKLSPELQESAKEENYSSTGYFKIIKSISLGNKNKSLEVIIYLNEELSTNILDITKDTIYIYNKNENGEKSRNVFIERVKNQ